MPQKPNRKDMQPYVASGEHGGEYTDYHAGTPYSKGYKPKKKEPTIETPDKQDEDIPQGRTTGDNYTKVNNYIGVKENSTYNKKQKEFISNFTKECDNRCNELISKAQELTGVKYKIGNGVCQYESSWWSNDPSKKNFIVRVDKTSLTPDAENDSYGMGGVFYHENGHLVDFTGDYSSKFISEKYNMSLSDMVSNELKGRSKDIYDELISKREQIVNDEVSKIDQSEIDNYSRVKDEYDAWNKAYYEEVNKKREEFLDGDHSYSKVSKWWQEVDKLDNEHRNSEEAKRFTEVLKNGDPISRAKRKAFNTFNRDYGDISDMLDSVGYRISMGHGRSYWATHRAGIEFFAEAFKTKATGMGKLFEYFPKSAEIFEEIIRSI